MPEFYILSLKWRTGDLLTWWKPNNQGYTVRLADAGRYTAEQVAAHPSYYDDGIDTLAVPCGDVDAESIRVVSNDGAIVARLRAAREALQERAQ